MTKTKTLYRCTACGHEVAKWVGRCPGCGEWGAVSEAVPTRAGGAALALPSTPATPITEVDGNLTVAEPTGVTEFDRVLGGGLVPGSVVLLSGEPGIGKSTLLLEVADRCAKNGSRALYVTAEESAGQVRLRADRTRNLNERLYLAAESDLATALGHVEQLKPSLLVVDSVQTMVAANSDGVLGGVNQVRTVTAALTSLAKTTGISVLLVGHVTKDGAIAGPRTLEHLVDVVLHFEGDRHSTLRTIRGVKNRFGSVDEVGCFELTEQGLECVDDPSGLFLHHRDITAPGTAVSVIMDGKRPMVGEVQALVADTTVPPAPRRAVSGVDFNRVAMVLAVLASHAKISLGNKEVYVSTVGGMRMTEPAADLAIALALASARHGVAVPGKVVAVGEVGLAGEVRRVPGITRRLAEAERLGFTEALAPPGTGRVGRLRIREVTTIAEALEIWRAEPRQKGRVGSPVASLAPNQPLRSVDG